MTPDTRTTEKPEPRRIIEMSDERWADYMAGFRDGYDVGERHADGVMERFHESGERAEAAVESLRAAQGAAPRAEGLDVLIREAWRFLDHITQQDYVGERVNVDVSALDRFRSVLRAAPQAEGLTQALQEWRDGYNKGWAARDAQEASPRAEGLPHKVDCLLLDSDPDHDGNCPTAAPRAEGLDVERLHREFGYLLDLYGQREVKTGHWATCRDIIEHLTARLDSDDR